jgi:hypothetical protein
LNRILHLFTARYDFLNDRNIGFKRSGDGAQWGAGSGQGTVLAADVQGLAAARLTGHCFV